MQTENKTSNNRDPAKITNLTELVNRIQQQVENEMHQIQEQVEKGKRTIEKKIPHIQSEVIKWCEVSNNECKNIGRPNQIITTEEVEMSK